MTLTAVPCYIRPMSRMPLWSQNTAAITLSVDFKILNSFNCREQWCFHYMLASFVSRLWWWIHVSSPVTMCSRSSRPPTKYCCKITKHKPFAISCVPLLVIKAPNVHTLCLTFHSEWCWWVAHETGSSYVAVHSLTVILLLIYIIFSVVAMASEVLAVVGLLLLSLSSVLTPPCRTSIHHFAIFCWFITSSPWTSMSWQWISATHIFLVFKTQTALWTLFLDHCSSWIAMSNWFLHTTDGKWWVTWHTVSTRIYKFLSHTNNNCMSFGWEIVHLVYLLSDHASYKQMDSVTMSSSLPSLTTSFFIV